MQTYNVKGSRENNIKLKKKRNVLLKRNIEKLNIKTSLWPFKLKWSTRKYVGE